eukprot:jgi/Mesen1/9008/ME000563S08325
MSEGGEGTSYHARSSEPDREPNPPCGAGAREAGLRTDYSAFVSASADSGDLNRALTLMDKARARGLNLDSSSLSNFFCPFGDEDQEQESAPPASRSSKRWAWGYKLKCGPGARGKAWARGSGRGSGSSQGPHGGGGDASPRKAATPGAEAANADRWRDLPMELLAEVLDLVDNRTVVIATGVCRGWRNAIGRGVADLSFSCLTDSALEAVAAWCRHLESLDLSMASALSDHVCADVAAAANGGAHTWQVLDLSGCLGVTETGVIAIADSCPDLRLLNLCGCEQAGTDKALQAIAKGCPRLQSLNLGWCERLTDAGVSALAAGCAGLRVLDLCGCLLITDGSIVQLAEKCRGLQALGLHCCRDVSDISMAALVRSSQCSSSPAPARHLGCLQEGCDGRTAHHGDCRQPRLGLIAPSWTHYRALAEASGSSSAGLVSLNLSGCTNLHAPVVQAVCDAFPALHTCPNRRSLNISGCLGLTSVHCRCIADSFQFAERYRPNGERGVEYHPRQRPL